MKFQDKLEKTIIKNNSLLCVGLDPDIEKFKQGETLPQFNKWIVDQTADLVCAYKPNIAFYAAAGIYGLEDLKRTVDYIHKNYPHIPVIFDAKRGDVGPTSEMYAKEIFDFFDADAVTVNPYLGEDSLEPFFKRKDKGIFILCKTSNPSSSDFQNQKVGQIALYQVVAIKIVAWNKKYGNLGPVIGATSPAEIKLVRQIAPDLTFLIPGIGAQKGNLRNVLKGGLRKDRQGLILSASRSIIYDQDPRFAAQKLRDEINKYRQYC